MTYSLLHHQLLVHLHNEIFLPCMFSSGQDKLGPNGVLLVPVLPLVAPYHGELLCSFNDINLCGIFNATEMPSTAVPLGLTKDGIPLGLQVRNVLFILI